MSDQQARRLAAVMFTDVAGYTAIMQADEESARIVRLRHREAIEGALADHGGALVQYLGDGSLCTFPSAVNAVAAGVQIQRALRDQVPLRIGIHQGEIAFDEQGIYGDSVNIASRIMTIALPGSVLVSDKAHDELKNQRGIDTVPLGTFELKNVRQAMTVHAVAADGLRVPSRAETIVAAPGRLAASPLPQLTRLVGRELELAEIRALLERNRLVTLTGGGGTGKTRLAIETALRSGSAFADGVAWIDLAALIDPDLVAGHVSTALGLMESRERSATQALVERLRPLALLLVLDNCEHLVESCARLVHEVLGRCPQVKILTTSRQALGILGENAWLVPTLSLPPAGEAVTLENVGRSEAVQLFVGLAQAARPGFVLTDDNVRAVVSICQRLDGIPLAIELAAARIRILPPEEMARRLDDVFGLLTTGNRTALPRHRTLREAIDWSHALLTDGERTLFRHLAIFIGGFTLEAAEAVCVDEHIEADSMLELLFALVDKSLVRSDAVRGVARFTLLEPVRQYALEELRATGEEDEVRARHARYFLTLAEETEPHIRGGSRRVERVARLERDHCNLRGAADWFAAEPSRAEEALRLDAAMLWLSFALGLHRESRERLTAALERDQPIAPSVRARALTTLGYQAIWQGDYAFAVTPLEEAVGILEEVGDSEGMAFALTGLGAAVGLTGDPERADVLLADVRTRLGDRSVSTGTGRSKIFLHALADYWRGVVAEFAGDAARARAAFEASVSIARALGDHPSIAHPLTLLARIFATDGDLAAAEKCLAEGLPIHSANDDRWGLAQGLDVAAYVAAGRGDGERALGFLAGSDGLRQALGVEAPPNEQRERARVLRALREDLDEVTFEKAYASGRARPLDLLVGEALASPAETRPTL